MIRLVSVIVLLLAALLVACGGANDNAESIGTPDRPRYIPNVTPSRSGTEGTSVFLPQPGTPAMTQSEATPVQREGDTTPNQTGTTAPVSVTTQSPQQELDDDRVEGLVSEWESDLASVAKVVACVERTLGLERPLRPEDFDLQANQPAILACVKAEVGGQ